MKIPTFLLAFAAIFVSAAVAQATVNSAPWPPVPGGAHLITASAKISIEIPRSGGNGIGVVYTVPATGVFVFLTGWVPSGIPVTLTSSTLGNLPTTPFVNLGPAAGVVLPKNDKIICTGALGTTCIITGYTEP